MKEYAKKPESKSRTLDSNPKVSEQVPVTDILQAYRERPMWNSVVQHKESVAGETKNIQSKVENKTGLPDGLKAGVEAKSGYSMSDVRVHYNSSRPAQLRALAYTQGNEIHVAPGQEIHLPHEAWHVVQQKQGRVQPTMQLKGVNVNNSKGLEHEADVMGEAATRGEGSVQMKKQSSGSSFSDATPVQMIGGAEMAAGYFTREGKRKSQQALIMERFGNVNRVRDVDPDKYREQFENENLQPEMIDAEIGIWRPNAANGEARPEDPPMYEPVRNAIHKAHNIYTSFKAQDNVPNARLPQYWEVLKKASGLIKSYSMIYKKNIRNLNIQDVANVRNDYEASLQRITVVLNNLVVRMLDDYKLDNHIRGMDNESLGKIKAAEGKGMWKEKWQAAIQKVNCILDEKWSQHKPKIKSWVAENKKGSFWKRIPALAYMEENMVGDVDYIGSLAKGYKSAPKQFMRFLPEKFDVDANLNAPPLAVYAISKGANIDRGTVKSEHIKPLKDFENSVWDELKIVDGIDITDPFEVFVKADNVADLMSGDHQDVKDAQRKEALRRRFQNIENRIWALKALHPGEVRDMLRNGFAHLLRENNSRLKEYHVSQNNAEQHSYNDVELTRIEYAIEDLVGQQQPPNQQQLPAYIVPNQVIPALEQIANDDGLTEDEVLENEMRNLEQHPVLQVPVVQPEAVQEG